jgi:ferredoxin-type protein NapH
MEKAKCLSTQTLRQRLFKYNTPRRIAQVLSFIFFSSIVFNLGALPLLFPVLWTWGQKVNSVGDAFTAMQLMLSGWNVSVVFPWVGLASFLIVGILIGKSMCGWVCPFGFIQDLIGFFRRKQTDLSVRTHENMVYVKYFVLAATLFIVASFSLSEVMGVSAGYQQAMGIFANAPFTVLSPSETLFATLPTFVHNFGVSVFSASGVDILGSIGSLSALFWAQFVIMIFVLGFVAYVPRSWCRYFCPHGAIMAIMNNFSFIGLRREPTKCEKGGCGRCVQVCPTRVPILDLPWEKFSHPECIYCMKCADACEDKAIKLTYP